MYYNDHEPPHFHAVYAGRTARIGIRPAVLLDGSLPPRCLGLVTEWATLHQDELLANWTRARAQQPLAHIEPLE